MKSIELQCEGGIHLERQSPDKKKKRKEKMNVHICVALLQEKKF
jgi:hypothetical protein